MCLRTSVSQAILVGLLLGTLTTAAAAADGRLPAGRSLGTALGQSERKVLQSLIERLEASHRPQLIEQAPPRELPPRELAGIPADEPTAEAIIAEQLARELAAEPRSGAKTARPPETAAATTPEPPAAPPPLGNAATASVQAGEGQQQASPTTVAPAASAQPPSFTLPNATAGQPIGRNPRPPVAADPPLLPAEVTPPLPPVTPPVAPGIHLSPGRPQQAPAPDATAATARAVGIEPVPAPPPARALSAPLPSLPPASLPHPDANGSRQVSAAPASTPPVASRRAPNPTLRRRALCTEILQRATLGELTEEDRAILKTQCR